MSDYPEENGCPPLPGPEFTSESDKSPEDFFQGHTSLNFVVELVAALEDLASGQNF